MKERNRVLNSLAFKSLKETSRFQYNRSIIGGEHMNQMQWTGDNLEALIQWSEQHVRVDQTSEGDRLFLITPDGNQPLTLGKWVFRLKNGTYEVRSTPLKEWHVSDIVRVFKGLKK